MRSKDSNMRFLNDFAKMMTGAVGSFTEVRHQIKGMVKERVEQVMNELDMVSRSDFDRVEAVAQKARERQIELEKRVAALEAQLKGKVAKPAKKAAVKKTAKGKKK